MIGQGSLAVYLFVVVLVAFEVVMKTHYETLSVSKIASDGEIKSAWRKKMQLLVPDKTIGDKKAEAEFQAVQEAYKVLSNKDKRKEYDEFLKHGGQVIRKPQIVREVAPSGIRSPLPNDVIDASRIIDTSNMPKGKPFRIF